MVDDSVFEKIKNLRQEINLMLAQRPEYIPLQEEIDRVLSTAGSQHNRLALIQDMLFTKFRELGNAMQDLKAECDMLEEEVNKIPVKEE